MSTISYKNNLYIPILRSVGSISNPLNPARTTPAGPPLETPDLQMMKKNKASCLNYGKTVWLKAKTMSEQIDYFFNTVNPTVTEYWERHIY